MFQRTLWAQAFDDTNGLSQDLQNLSHEADGFMLLLTQDPAEQELITQDVLRRKIYELSVGNIVLMLHLLNL